MTGALSAFAPPSALPGFMPLHGQQGWLGRGTDLSLPRSAFGPAPSDSQHPPPTRAFHLRVSSHGKGLRAISAGFGGVGAARPPSTQLSSRSPSPVEWMFGGACGLGRRAVRRTLVMAASSEVKSEPLPAEFLWTPKNSSGPPVLEFEHVEGGHSC